MTAVKVYLFSREAENALVDLAEMLAPDAKMTLVVYFDGKPEQDIIITNGNLGEVVAAVERRRTVPADGGSPS
ncbi:hypothetical protein [Roseomonas indoligenes]|uniref:Uncharacterized protein n=1 Tax=Roseomonas indoligenes TaxID=2820811 RepID=A0A940S3G8_9PROT|nr:hypothetical protein [Pararoseomonas indoligenes]MBP0492221.1 hypothetical protein [Pararoseomonas indoligenes]